MTVNESSVQHKNEGEGDILSESLIAKEKRAKVGKDIAEKVQLIKVRLAETEQRQRHSPNIDSVAITLLGSGSAPVRRIPR